MPIDGRTRQRRAGVIGEPYALYDSGCRAVYRRLRTIPFCNASGENRVPSQIARSLPLYLPRLAARCVAIRPRKLRNAPAPYLTTRIRFDPLAFSYYRKKRFERVKYHECARSLSSALLFLLTAVSPLVTEI
jgi:hypothetical protein